MISSAVMFGYYHLVLRNRTFHHYNRYYLLAAVLISLLLPALKIDYFTLEVSNNIFLLINEVNLVDSINTSNEFSLLFYVFSVVIILISAVLFARFMHGILQIEQFKKRFPNEKMQGITFYNTDLESAPFSFFKNLFWKNSILLQSDLGKQILKHEMVHIEQKHSLDKIFLEIICGVLWFNPFFWMIKKEINLIHEYLADNKAVKKSDTKAFAQMLLASHFSGDVLPGTSPFLSSNLKKRLKMLQKPKSQFSYIRRIMALPLLFLLAFAYMVNAKNKEIKILNTLIEEAVQTQQVVQQQQAEQKKISPVATPTNTVTERSAAQKKLDTIKEKIYEKWTIADPAVVNLYRSTEENLFVIEGKEVSKQEYIDYYVRYRRNKDYGTGQSKNNYQPLDYGKQAMFFAGKYENLEENTKVIKPLMINIKMCLR